MNSLFDDVRSAAHKRDDLAKQVEAARTRLRSVDVDREAAERLADVAAADLRSALADGIDPSSTRAASIASSTRADNLRGTGVELKGRLGALEREHDTARRQAARARETLAVALAEVRKSELREAADTFARCLAAYHHMAASAHRDHVEATGAFGKSGAARGPLGPPRLHHGRGDTRRIFQARCEREPEGPRAPALRGGAPRMRARLRRFRRRRLQSAQCATGERPCLTQ